MFATRFHPEDSRFILSDSLRIWWLGTDSITRQSYCRQFFSTQTSVFQTKRPHFFSVLHHSGGGHKVGKISLYYCRINSTSLYRKSKHGYHRNKNIRSQPRERPPGCIGTLLTLTALAYPKTKRGGQRGHPRPTRDEIVPLLHPKNALSLFLYKNTLSCYLWN